MVMMLARRKRLTEGEVRHRVDEVQARTAWLDAVSGLSPDGVLVFERDPQGQHRLVFTNPAFSQLFRLRPVDLLGLSESAVDEWLSGLGTEEAPMAPLGLRDVTVTLAGPPGRVLQRSAREDTRARVYYFSDVTRESEVERLKSEFLTTAAHELRTPLASVYGFAELLTLHDMPAEKRGRLIAIVYRQAGVLKHLVDELLDLARIDARGDRDLVRERHDMRVVAETACESVQVPGQASRITMELGAQALWVMADSAKLQQALVNALSNAMKYSDQGSPITLRTWSAQRQQVAWVGVRVTDKGMGMTPEQTARAFERFYRADPSGHILGAGLGLAIIKEMMTLHGGEVELHSLEGAGTEITLWLPMLHDMEAACTEGQAESALTS
jgi:signal transduction histidine kinase